MFPDILKIKEQNMAKFMILGAGKEGTALAYYLSKYYNPEKIYLVDQRLDTAVRAKDLVERLTNKRNIECVRVKLSSPLLISDSLEHFTKLGMDVVISALPHKFNLEATRFAVLAGASYCDFGFDAGIVVRQLSEIGPLRQEKEISIIPNCGVGPGLVNILALGGAEETKCDTVKIYIGGNPQNPDNAWRYKKLFTGLLHEYTGSVAVLEKGELVVKQVPCEPEDIWVDGIGQLEAFLAQTSFGLTAKLLQEAGVKNAFDKTIRFPGHYTVVKAFQELGFFSEIGLVINGEYTIPLNFTTKLINENLPDAEDDFLFLKVIFEKVGKEVMDVEMMLRNDTQTGFSAMQQSTASVVAVIAAMQASGKLPYGAYLPEQEVDYKYVIEELLKMNFPIVLS
jgi:lysine 6-dehydrogenase